MAVVGVGTDLVSLERARQMLARLGDYPLERLLTDDERSYVLQRPDPAPHFAARLAAKEAVYKALQGLPNARGIGWRDIEVCRAFDGRPSVRLHGLAAEVVGRASGPITIHLSLSHSHEQAAAMAVVEVDTPPL
ncbi:MAG: holo-ACP synthase [Gemmatimonadota bacterium]|nr:holo-ACP synthase [Gemmatimonadota bacterium]